MKPPAPQLTTDYAHATKPTGGHLSAYRRALGRPTGGPFSAYRRAPVTLLSS
jgi:hypothetical protein